MIKTHIIYSLLIATILTSCKAQNNNLKQDTMKTFDIETFNKNKTQTVYKFITNDSTIVRQDEEYDEYFEIVKPKKSDFETLNTYFKNGKLKSTVQRFPNDFLAGVMKEYDEQGILIKETDYDRPYKFTFKDILKFIKKRGINMNGYYFRLGRNVVDNKPVWGMTWEKEDKSGLKHIGFNGITGEIIQENDKDYPSEE